MSVQNTAPEPELYDVIIVGGGPAGLSAALTLGRCLRKVLVCHKGETRNSWSREMHAYLTRDCTAPSRFREHALKDLEPYGVEVREVEITKATSIAEGFELHSAENEAFRCRKLLLTTGLVDILPNIPGFLDCYGISIHHCPYCDGWEHRGQRIAVYAQGGGAKSLPFMMQGWSAFVSLCLDGAKPLEEFEEQQLACNNIPVFSQKISRVEHENQQVKKIVFEDGKELECDAIFFSTGTEQRSGLIKQLGCKVSKKKLCVKTDKFQQTNIAGCYVAGDAARDMNLVINAAAQGTKAAVAINMAIQEEAKILPEVAQAVEDGEANPENQ
jgi:thioredoxin reductase